MNTQIKELIAVGASVTANCQPCLTYHVGKAREAGVAEEEIREAISIAKMVRKGALAKMDQFTLTVIGASKETAVVSDGGCGCGSDR
jgi:AhpD family alkylhydroperoxidase